MIKIKMPATPKGAVLVIRNEEGKFLLLKRASDSIFAPNKWGFPGGKIEEGETAEAAAIRETVEETQLRVSDVRFLGVFNEAVAAFSAGAYEGEVVIDFEHSDWAWAEWAQLNNYDLAPSVWEILEKVKKSDD
jgi:8-oxo-dGTP diphosphatase